MSEEEMLLAKKDQLAVAIAQGKSIVGWARKNEVPTSTAYRWASERDVRRQVADWRRRTLDRALGQMARRSIAAVNTISELGAAAESESVRLRAARALLSDLLAVSNHADFEYRLSEMEERLKVRNVNAARPA